MILLRNFINIFYVAELRKKVLFTLGVLFIYRIGNHIPVIGLNLIKLKEMMEQKETMLGGLFSYLDMFSGGNLSQGMIFALGISPYITASIMMQMLTLSIPSLEQLAKEGELGRKVINQYTRYLTFGVSLMQSLGVSILLERSGLAIEPGWAFRFLLMLSLTVGSMFVMWLGEQISLYGVGSSSMIIFAGIVSRIPVDLFTTIGAIQQGIFDPIKAIIVLVMIVFITACIVFLERGDRKIPVQYTRRVVGQRMYAGQSSYIPFKINTAGVMPVIFASAVLNVPYFFSSLLASRWEGFKWVYDSLSRGGLVFNVLDFVLIIFFSFFYTAIQYNPEELAENLKKGGGFIPGIRPGKKTAEFFNYLLTRIGLVGAIYLAILAIMPTVIQIALKLPFYLSTLSGTGMLIMVGVALETASQIESYLIEHRYEGFLSSGRLKGRGAR